jgi:hypothetical protein
MKRAANPAGYSGTPLPQKLGLKAGMRVLFVDAPPQLDRLLAGAPAGLVRLARIAPFDFALAFAMKANALEATLAKLAPKMDDAGMIWVAWPKKASGVPTNITEDIVRRLGIAAGLVDVKVCAIDATWSGLKLVRRLRDRAR